jgi:hypothetical protein
MWAEFAQLSFIPRYFSDSQLRPEQQPSNSWLLGRCFTSSDDEGTVTKYGAGSSAEHCTLQLILPCC